jgi:hypothetical protein
MSPLFRRSVDSLAADSWLLSGPPQLRHNDTKTVATQKLSFPISFPPMLFFILLFSCASLPVLLVALVKINLLAIGEISEARFHIWMVELEHPFNYSAG